MDVRETLALGFGRFSSRFSYQFIIQNDARATYEGDVMRFVISNKWDVRHVIYGKIRLSGHGCV